MTRRLIRLTVLLTLVGNSLNARRSNCWVVLPADEAQTVSFLCSRDALPAVERGWLPTDTDVAAMEKKFKEIPRLQKSKTDSGVPIRAPQSYYRQYVGVIANGRKFIYINAICGKRASDWREKLENDCDGGCNWGVLYDVQTGIFSNFGINGIA